MQALILVQAASRGSSGSISKIIDERDTSTTSGPLVTLSCEQKRAVCNVLWRKYCTNLKQFDYVDAYRNKLKHQKTADGHFLEPSGAPYMHANQQNLSVTFLHRGAGVNGLVSSKDRTEMLGIPTFSLDSSFHASSSASSPLSLHSNAIPVMQVLLVEDNDKTEVALQGEVTVETVESVHDSTSASVLPIRGTCSYALLILPLPLPAADCTTLMNKVILKSTDSFAVLHLT